jgi:hypothetical protein
MQNRVPHSVFVILSTQLNEELCKRNNQKGG